MRYLLDTCTLLWALGDINKLPIEFLKILEEPSNDVIVSVVCYWEVVIKKSLGKLEIPEDWVDKIEKTGFFWLNLEPKHIRQLEKLPLLHKDPFDRLLIAQAQFEKLKFLTLDEKILKYGL